MFSLICTRINGWVNSGVAGDLRRHRAHYDVIVMTSENYFIEAGLIIYASMNWIIIDSGGRFKNAYELLNLRALKISMLYKICSFQCMGKIFCVEFQRVPLKFHTKYHTHTLKDADFIDR